MSSAIEAKGLVKTYPKGVRAVDGIDLAVEAGSIFGLLGPNGAGKSTTVKMLTTLTRPDEGTATVAGHDVVRAAERVRQAIGVVSQKPGVDPDATGRENLVLQGDLYGLPGAEVRRRTDELLGRFGLAEAARRLVRTYSGGMQRKLDVAMGLINRPQVLFLDEPTTGLDPEARAEMWSAIERLAREESVTVLLTTHYLEEADRLAGRLAIVDRGRIVAIGTPTSSRASCAATRSWSRSRTTITTRSAPSGESPAFASRRSTVGSCAHEPTTAPVRCRRCSRRWTEQASRS
jgi:ABC-2 type transport system ATP-binding protein